MLCAGTVLKVDKCWLASVCGVMLQSENCCDALTVAATGCFIVLKALLLVGAATPDLEVRLHRTMKS